jgi:hypothetical protein
MNARIRCRALSSRLRYAAGLVSSIHAASADESSKMSPSTNATRSPRSRHCSIDWVQDSRTSSASTAASGPW